MMFNRTISTIMVFVISGVVCGNELNISGWQQYLYSMPEYIEWCQMRQLCNPVNLKMTDGRDCVVFQYMKIIMEQRNGEHGIVQDLRAIILDTEHFCDAVKSDTEISSLISWVHSLSSTLLATTEPSNREIMLKDLFKAAEHHNITGVVMLIKHHRNFDDLTESDKHHGYTILHYASRDPDNGDSMVRQVVEALSDLNPGQEKMLHFINLKDMYGCTALSIALRRENSAAAKYLIQHGADHKSCNYHGNPKCKKLLKDILKEMKGTPSNQ